MPDALSKTVPIWCCVMNRVLFPDIPSSHDLHSPPQVISSSEHSQITARIPGFVESFLNLQLDLPSLRKHITKPIRPMWMTQDSCMPDNVEGFDKFHPVICCTASRRVPGTEASEGGYIQGSGDDTENWAFGLIPTLFWSNVESLLSTPESELPGLIQELCAASVPPTHETTISPLKPTSRLHVAALVDLAARLPEPQDIVISLSPVITEISTWQVSPTEMMVGIGPHKLGSRNLRPALSLIVEFVGRCLHENTAGKWPNIFIACSNGKDHSIGVALALLCLFFDDEGNGKECDGMRATTGIDKQFIRRRLGWIMTAMSDANPSRSTLQSVNSYLMERPN